VVARNDLTVSNLPELRAGLEASRQEVVEQRKLTREKLAASSEPEHPDVRRTAFEPLLKAERERLLLALSILRSEERFAIPELVANTTDGGTEQLLQCLEGLGSAAESHRRLYHAASALNRTLTHANPSNMPEEIRSRILGECQAVVTQLVNIRQKLERTPYPFPHKKENACAADTCLAITPDHNDPMDCLHKASYTFNGFVQLYVRTLGHLVVLADRVESALGMEALPDVASDAVPPSASVAS
jgi:hypothetical protein